LVEFSTGSGHGQFGGLAAWHRASACPTRRYSGPACQATFVFLISVQRAAIRPLSFNVARRSDGVIVDSDYKRAVDARDERVWKENYLLNEVDKTLFVEEPDLLYGAFAAPLHEFVEISHPRFKASNNSKFEYPKFAAKDCTLTIEFGENAQGRFV
jgi:hypothetical protein